jgi:hypothetical protein
MSETDVDPGTKPVPETVTGRLDPAVPDDGNMNVRVGGAEVTLNIEPLALPEGVDTNTE